MGFAVQGVRLTVVSESAIVHARILERFAERELEMHALLFAQLLAQKDAFHCLDVIRGEAKRFEIRQAPVRLAERRLHGDRATVGGHALVLPALGPQRMAKAHPDLGLVREATEDTLICFDGSPIIPCIGEDCGFEIQVAGILRLLGE